MEHKLLEAIKGVDDKVDDKVETKPFKGKWVSILGDSISTYKGFNPDGQPYTEQADLTSVDKTWWGYLLTKLEAKLCVNNSENGISCCGDAGAVAQDRHKKLHREPGTTYRNLDGTTTTATTRQDPDIILVYLGTNDYGAQKKLTDLLHVIPEETDAEGNQQSIRLYHIDWTIQYPKDYKDVSCFDNAYRTLLKDLMYDYPYATVYCIAPFIQNRGDGSKYPVTTNGPDGFPVAPLFNDHIRQLSTIYCDKFINLGRMGIQPKEAMNGTDKFYYSGGAHPTAIGHKIVGEYVYRNMINDCVSWSTRNDF